MFHGCFWCILFSNIVNLVKSTVSPKFKLSPYSNCHHLYSPKGKKMASPKLLLLFLNHSEYSGIVLLNCVFNTHLEALWLQTHFTTHYSGLLSIDTCISPSPVVQIFYYYYLQPGTFSNCKGGAVVVLCTYGEILMSIFKLCLCFFTLSFAKLLAAEHDGYSGFTGGASGQPSSSNIYMSSWNWRLNEVGTVELLAADTFSANIRYLYCRSSYTVGLTWAHLQNNNTNRIVQKL